MKIEVELPDYIEDDTISSVIEDRIASRLISEIKSDAKAQLQSSLVARIHAEVDTIVAAAFEERFTPTNTFGESRGEPTSIRELAITAAENRMDEKVDPGTGERPRYNGPKCSRIEWMVGKAVGEAIQEQISGIESQVRDEAYRAMAKHLEAKFEGDE